MTTDFSNYPNMPASHRAVVRELDAILKDNDGNASFLAWCTAMRGYLLDGSAEYEAVVSVAQEIGYRNPEFEGDIMGRWGD